MEHQDKLYEQFKDAAHKEEQKDFARMEAVWNRVEEKLDRKQERRAAAWWKYTGIAAALLLFMSLGYILIQNDKHPLPNVSPSNQQVTTIDTQKVQETVRPLKQAVTSAEIDTQAIKETLKPQKASSTVAYEHSYLKKISEIEADSIHYNSKTKKARVWNSRTDQGEFRVKAEITKKEEATPLVNAAPALNNNRLNTAVGDPSALYSNSLNKPGDKAYPVGRKIYTGIVKDKSGPMPLASVILKSNRERIETDWEGKFTVEAETGDEIEVLYTGYKWEKIKLGNNPSLEITMTEDNHQYVVVDSYRSNFKEKTTTETTTVTSKAIEGRPNASFIQSLQGQIPGLNVTSGSGEPGNNNGVASNDYSRQQSRAKSGNQSANFKTNTKDKQVVDNSVGYTSGDVDTEISNSLQGRVAGVTVNTAAGQPGGNTTVVLRGAGTLNGNQEPLYVIDGMPMTGEDMKKIDPNNIESVSVIKDGATAIYGNRGANGVIVVKTKNGKPLTKEQIRERRKAEKKRLKGWDEGEFFLFQISDFRFQISDLK